MYVSGRRIESIGNHKWGDVMKRRTFLMGAGAALGGIAAGFPRPAVVMAQGKPLSKITIGYQSLWAGGGEIFETLRHTNILELNGIEADFNASAKLMSGPGSLDDPHRLLEMQMEVYKLAQNVEIMSRTVSEATSGVKTILQTQV